MEARLRGSKLGTAKHHKSGAKSSIPRIPKGNPHEASGRSATLSHSVSTSIRLDMRLRYLARHNEAAPRPASHEAIPRSRLRLQGAVNKAKGRVTLNQSIPEIENPSGIKLSKDVSRRPVYTIHVVHFLSNYGL